MLVQLNYAFQNHVMEIVLILFSFIFLKTKINSNYVFQRNDELKCLTVFMVMVTCGYGNHQFYLYCTL